MTLLMLLLSCGGGNNISTTVSTNSFNEKSFQGDKPSRQKTIS